MIPTTSFGATVLNSEPVPHRLKRTRLPLKIALTEEPLSKRNALKINVLCTSAVLPAVQRLNRSSLYMVYTAPSD